MENRLYSTILSQQSPERAEGQIRFFKCKEGEYAADEIFLGVGNPDIRDTVKKHWKSTTFDELEQCITSRYHEVRLAALLTLIQLYTHAKDELVEEKCINFYLNHINSVNNWNLVDLSCYELLGRWLLNRDREILYQFAIEGNTIWKQRIAIVTTMWFVRHNQLDDTYAIAQIFLNTQRPMHDLIQKACGWMLREAGKRDMERLYQWIIPQQKNIPRTMLRYAIEKFPPEKRAILMKKL